MSNFWSILILVIVLAHFVVGFGYLMYKLSPKKGKKNENRSAN